MAENGETSEKEKVETIITQRLIDAKGVWSEFGRPSFPITTSDIRRWALAVYYPEQPPRLYWDEEYAKTTRWGGIIAPRGLNPGAWPVPGLDGDGDEATGPGQNSSQPHPGEPGQFMLNGGSKITYLEPMRPGDTIRSRSRISGWSEREGRLGLMAFVDTESESVNQKDEVVSRSVYTLIRY